MGAYVPHQRTLDAYYRTIEDDERRAEDRRRGIARDIESLLSDPDESALWVTAFVTGDVIRFTGSTRMRPDLREGAAPGATAEMPVAEIAKIYHQ